MEHGTCCAGCHMQGEDELPSDGYKVAVIDLGVKKNIVRCLLERGCSVTVYPAETPAEEIIADAPDGIMLTNGPGDPKDNVKTIEEIKKLFATKIQFSQSVLDISFWRLQTVQIHRR